MREAAGSGPLRADRDLRQLVAKFPLDGSQLRFAPFRPFALLLLRSHSSHLEMKLTALQWLFLAQRFRPRWLGDLSAGCSLHAAVQWPH